MKDLRLCLKCVNRLQLWMALAALCLFYNRAEAQDPQFSQYYSTPLYTNPALTGAVPNITFGVNYRRQSLNLPVPREAAQFSAIVPIFQPGSQSKQLGGLGGTVFQEKAGEAGQFKTTGFMFSAAYDWSLKFDNSEVVIVGVQGGLYQQALDFSSLTFGSQYSPFVGLDLSQSPDLSGLVDQVTYPVINAGIMYYFNPQRSYVLYTGSAFGGVSVSNINRPNSSFSTVDTVSFASPMLFRGHTGLEFYLNRQLKWAPQILLLYQTSQFQFNAGTYFSYNLKSRSFDSKPMEIILGLWYRWGDAGIVSVGINSPTYTVGFSYDLNVTDLGSEGQGVGATFEVSVGFKILRSSGLRNFSTPLI